MVLRRPRWCPLALMASRSRTADASSAMAAAYSATGWRWQDGPGRVYDALARVVVAHAPSSLAGSLVVDLGAGTGAASRAAAGVGARLVVAVDAALGMLADQAEHRPPAVVGDAVRLPVRSSSVDAVVAAFSLNHLPVPWTALKEAARIVRSGGSIVVSTYASDDSHPVKAAVEQVLVARGWTADQWYADLRDCYAPLLATASQCLEAADRAGIKATVRHVRVPFPELSPSDLVAWRLGMAQHASFVAALRPPERAELEVEALQRLGEHPPLVRSIMVMSAVV